MKSQQKLHFKLDTATTQALTQQQTHHHINSATSQINSKHIFNATELKYTKRITIVRCASIFTHRFAPFAFADLFVAPVSCDSAPTPGLLRHPQTRWTLLYSLGVGFSRLCEFSLGVNFSRFPRAPPSTVLPRGAKHPRGRGISDRDGR